MAAAAAGAGAGAAAVRGPRLLTRRLYRSFPPFQLCSAFAAITARRAARVAAQQARRRALRDGAVSDDEDDWEETTTSYDQVVSQSEMVMKSGKK